MKAETVFKPGEKIWTIVENKAINVEIDSIKINIDKNKSIEIEYWIKQEKNGSSDWKTIKEAHCYRTKQALLDSL